MQNDKGKLVDLYIPRKWTTASVQINIGDVDPETGVYTKTFTTFAFSGNVRSQGESNDSLDRLATQSGYLKNTWSYVQ
ncbi:ribosomal protein S21e [Piromyces finnis]|uniref:Ribosomal protein S21e n=1 Tax=Piromyces finnis TaxID=1754191 RepID=A0A1Y1UHG3_9FUNG|nr:ribosomal protein S21e [Piromyces finnis]|eukprot:ORX37491.1 ribosomal protein S21e [Piromyces finnis]